MIRTASFLQVRTFFCLVIAVAGAAGVPRATSAQEVYGSLGGVVTDSAGYPAASARVTLAGTAFGATSDARGRYEIMLVPAGEYLVRVESGGGSGQRGAVRIRAGMRVTLDLSVGIDRTPVPLASDPDVTSRSSVSGDELRRLGHDDPRFALAQHVGVVIKGATVSIGQTPNLSVRGDAPGEASAFVDGAPARFQISGVHGMPPATNALEEVSTTTGVPAVSFADTRGGVIGYVTRSGGPVLRGGFHAESDEPFAGAMSAGYNRFEGDVGGPLPGVRNLSWFFSASLQGQRSAYRGLGAADVPVFSVTGVDTIVQRNTGPQLDTLPLFGAQTQLARPMDWTTLRRIHGRVLFSWGRGASVSLTALTGDLQRRFYPGASLVATGLHRGSWAASRLLVLNVAQPLAGRTLALEVNASLGSDEREAGPLTGPSELATRDPALGVAFSRLRFEGLDQVPPVDDDYIRRLRSGGGAALVPYQGQNGRAAFQAGRMNPYGLSTGWLTHGIDGPISRSSERRVSGRAQLRWRPSGAHQVTFGADLDRADLNVYSSDVIDLLDLNAFTASPARIGLFAGDRMEFGPAVIEAGVRYDRFAPGAEFPVVPARIFNNPAWNPADYPGSVAALFEPARTQAALSPRLRLGYAFSSRSSVRLGFGQQVEPPAYGRMFSGINTDAAFGSQSFVYGRDLDFLKSTLFEFGVRHVLTRAAAVDVAVYSKTLAFYTPLFVGVYDPFVGTTVNRLRLEPVKGNSTRGVDARLDWRAADLVTAQLAWSFTSRQIGVVFGQAQRVAEHALHATFDVRAPEAWTRGGLGRSVLGDLDALVTVRANSGAPYTRLINDGLGTITPSLSGTLAEPVNHSRLPWTRALDLRFTRLLPVGGQRWVLFADFRDVLNLRNVVALYAETGGETNSRHRAELELNAVFSVRGEAGPALLPDGETVDLRIDCSTWNNATSCVSLRRVEARFGNGDRLYSAAEQVAAFGAWYDAFHGPHTLRLPGRTIRIGFELRP